MNNAYPKTFTHRDNHHSVVTVANAEQEAQLPAEYLPVGVAAVAAGASQAPSDFTLSTEYSEFLAARETLARDRAVLDEDREKLTAGYKASVAKLEADRAALAAEIEAWEKAKAGEHAVAAAAQPAEPDPAAAAAADAADAAPAKRTRTTKEG